VTEPPTPPSAPPEDRPCAVRRVLGLVRRPAVLKLLAALMLGLPLAGIAWHVVVYLTFDLEAVVAYGAGPWMKASAATAIFLLVVNWFHYRHTRWAVDLVSRVLLYCWAVSMALLWVRVRGG